MDKEKQVENLFDGGKIYRCTRDDSGGQGTILHYVPSQLVGIYFEEAE